MASSGDEESPPGISGPQDSDDDSVNNDEAGRDVAFYYKDDGAEVRGPYSRDTFSRWFRAGHFPRGTVLGLDDQFAEIAGTAEELFPMCFPPPGSPPVDVDKKKRKKSNNKKKKKKSRGSSPSSSDSSSSSSSSSSDSAAGRRRKRLKAGDEIKIKATTEPPDAATQRAIWEAASLQPRAVSLAEQELNQRAPGKDASAGELMRFNFELMQIRQRHPTPATFALDGKLIRSTHQLPADVPLARGLPNWTAPLALRYFRPMDGRSLIDIDRDTAKSHVVTVGDASFYSSSSTSGPPPDPPKSATEFQLFGERLLEFGLASNRFTPEEGDMIRVHMKFCQRLLVHYPLADVLLYDDNVRFRRHRFADNAWSQPDEQVFEDTIRRPSDARRLLKPPPGNPAFVPSDDDNSSSSTKKKKKKKSQNRPTLKHLEDSSGADICRKFNFGFGDCELGEKCKTNPNMAHICMFCMADHRLKDCDAAKKAHPADFKKGWGSRR